MSELFLKGKRSLGLNIFSKRSDQTQAFLGVKNSLSQFMFFCLYWHFSEILGSNRIVAKIPKLLVIEQKTSDSA